MHPSTRAAGTSGHSYSIPPIYASLPNLNWLPVSYLSFGYRNFGFKAENAGKRKLFNVHGYSKTIRIFRMFYEKRKRIAL